MSTNIYRIFYLFSKKRPSFTSKYQALFFVFVVSFFVDHILNGGGYTYEKYLKDCNFTITDVKESEEEVWRKKVFTISSKTNGKFI